MYRVYSLRRAGYAALKTVTIQQAGGCTHAELDRECERKARARAAQNHGGVPTDWRVQFFLGAYTSRVAAETVARELG